MASTKTHDICLAVGKYTTASGETKTQYRKIGALMEGDNGPFLLLHAEVLNMPLFALANRDRRDSVIVSLFEAENRVATARPDQANGLDDDIPW